MDEIQLELMNTEIKALRQELYNLNASHQVTWSVLEEVRSELRDLKRDQAFNGSVDNALQAHRQRLYMIEDTVNSLRSDINAIETDVDQIKQDQALTQDVTMALKVQDDTAW